MEQVKLYQAKAILESRAREFQSHIHNSKRNGDYYHGLAKENIEFMSGVLYVVGDAEGFNIDYWRGVMDTMFEEWNTKHF